MRKSLIFGLLFGFFLLTGLGYLYGKSEVCRDKVPSRHQVLINSNNVLNEQIDLSDTNNVRLPVSIASVKTDYATLVFPVDDGPISKALQLFGEFDGEQLPVFRAYVGSGDQVIEIGANIGVFTTFFAKTVGSKGRVYAFEVQNSVSQILSANLVLNNLHSRVHVINAALGSKEMTEYCVHFKPHPRASGSLSVANAAAQCSSRQHAFAYLEEKEVFETGIISLDNLLLKPNFIKIDAEGMDALILQGAKQTIAKHRPVIFAEDHIDAFGKREVQSFLCSISPPYIQFLHKFEPLLARRKRLAKGKEIVSYWEQNTIGIPTEKLSSYLEVTRKLSGVQEVKCG